MRLKLTLARAVALGAIFAAPPAESQGHDEEGATMRGFSWVVESRLAALPRPGGWRPLDDDLDFLAGQGIALLVSLTEVPTDPEALARHGMRALHLPVPDFAAPGLDQLAEFVAAVDAAAEEGEPVAVHCAAGLGRSGTFAAAYLIARGATAEVAIAELRRLRPGSIETPEQERRLAEFALSRRPEEPETVPP